MGLVDPPFPFASKLGCSQRTLLFGHLTLASSQPIWHASVSSTTRIPDECSIANAFTAKGDVSLEVGI